MNAMPHVSDQFKQHQQRIWAAGDFSMVATPTMIVGERLCESLDLRAGQRVLDIATGSGNTALAAARRYCEVTGVDFVPSLLDRARERAAAERLDIEFREADAESLPFADGTFDVIVSTFGVMFAPDQARAASELLRVCRPGGKIGLTTWPPEGFIFELQRTAARYSPAPPNGFQPPVLWGTETRLHELLGKGVSSLSLIRKTFVMRHPSVDDWLEFTRTYFGPVRQLVQSLDPERQRAISGEVIELARRHNRSGDATMAVPADYVEVVAVRRR
jgi:SAM-dependent methyltransferase